MDFSVDDVIRTIKKDNFINKLSQIMRQNNEKIMTIYRQAELWDTREKADKSPVTAADLASHHFLSAQLSTLLPGVPVLSEEGVTVGYETRNHWSCCWLVDPLDGTKEFIRRSGEFSVNVALLCAGEPVIGALAVPDRDAVYIGVTKPIGSARIWRSGQIIDLPRLTLPAGPPVLAISRRNDQYDVVAFGKAVGANPVFRQMGAATKFCALAEGKIDVYPRFSPVCEWDVAAGHALIKSLGAEVYSLDGQPLRYNQRSELNDIYFCACLPLLAGNILPTWSKVLEEHGGVA